MCTYINMEIIYKYSHILSVRHGPDAQVNCSPVNRVDGSPRSERTTSVGRVENSDDCCRLLAFIIAIIYLIHTACFLFLYIVFALLLS